MVILLSLGRQTIGCQGARCSNVHHIRGPLLESKDRGCSGPLSDLVENEPKSFVLPLEEKGVLQFPVEDSLLFFEK